MYMCVVKIYKIKRRVIWALLVPHFLVYGKWFILECLFGGSGIDLQFSHGHISGPEFLENADIKKCRRSHPLRQLIYFNFFLNNFLELLCQNLGDASFLTWEALNFFIADVICDKFITDHLQNNPELSHFIDLNWSCQELLPRFPQMRHYRVNPVNELDVRGKRWYLTILAYY